MMIFLACRGDLSNRAVAEATWGSGDAHVQSTATRQPRLQAFGARGAPYLTLGFAAKPSPSAPWAQGLLSAFWERGPRTCLPTACSVAAVAGLYGPSSSTRQSRPLRGGRRKTSSGAASPGCLARSGDIKAGQTSRGSRDVSHDDRHQEGAGRAPLRAASLFPLWC